MLRRTIAASLLLVVGTLAVPAGSAPPAAAQTPGFQIVAGNLTGDASAEVFWYYPGTATDYLVTISNGGVHGGTLSSNAHQFAVNGSSYIPLVGDFDGDNHDEILWYGPGSTPDTMWHFRSLTRAVSVPYSVNGTYRPLVGDFTGDGVDDVFWYAPGAAGDPLWDFNPGGTYTSVSRPVNGTYQPIVISRGRDNTDDIYWWGSLDIPNTVWDFTRGTTNYIVQLDELGFAPDPIPFAFDMRGEGWRSGDMFLYWPGTRSDPARDHYLSSIACVWFETVDGTYGPIVVADFLGDGGDDIWWITPNGGDAWLWDFDVDADGVLSRYRYGQDDSSTGTFGPTTMASPPFTDTHRPYPSCVNFP